MLIDICWPCDETALHEGKYEKLAINLRRALFIRILVQVAAQNETNTDVSDALDEIAQEIVNMQGKDAQHTETTAGGQRTVVSDIEKLKKIAQILEAVGQAILPAVVDGQVQVNAQNSDTNSAKVNVLPPKGLKLLQHHSSLASNLNDAPPIKSPTSVDAQTE